MIVDAIQSLAQLLTKSSSIQSDQSGRQAAYQMQLTPGQEVRAEVMASLPNQRYLARIAGKLFNIELPVIVQPGETLQLTYLSGEPNLTFTLSKSQNSPSPVNISDTGRFLHNIAADGTQSRQAGQISRGDPVIEGAPKDTALFARLLGEAIGNKGTFYESHLLQWFFGERSLRDLLKEPQGKLSRRINVQGKTAEGEDQLQEAGESSLDEDAAEKLSQGGKAGAAVDPRLVPIVREQMHTLHTGQVLWQGEIWPGQEMDWSIGEENGRDAEGSESSWVSTLHLGLPKLGELSMTLRLEQGGVSVRISSDSESACALMQMESQRLAAAMESAGIRFSKVTITHGTE